MPPPAPVGNQKRGLSDDSSSEEEVDAGGKATPSPKKLRKESDPSMSDDDHQVHGNTGEDREKRVSTTIAELICNASSIQT
jgi:hypothetical protein